MKIVTQHSINQLESSFWAIFHLVGYGVTTAWAEFQILLLSLTLSLSFEKSRIQFQRNSFAFHWKKYVHHENKNCVKIVSIVLNKNGKCCWNRKVFFFYFLFVSTSTWLDIRMKSAQRKESKWNECKSVRWTDFLFASNKNKNKEITNRRWSFLSKQSVCARVCLMHFTGRLSFARVSCQETFQTLRSRFEWRKKMFIQLFNMWTMHILWHSLSVCRFSHMCNFQKQRALHISLLNRWVVFFPLQVKRNK